MGLLSLNKPYLYEPSASKRVLFSAVISLFVFLFLYFFEPFKISNLKGNLLFITLGYGLTCFVVMLLLNIGIVAMFTSQFNEEKWTTGRELTWTMVNLFFIGIANGLYTIWMGFGNFSIGTFLKFELYTLAVGIFPIGVIILLVEARQSKRYERESETLNEQLKGQQKKGTHREINLVSESGNEDISLELDQLLFVRSEDNYVKIYHLKNNEIRQEMIRSNLKRIQENLSEGLPLMRCHKSYLVNLDHVRHLSGNAQGLKLHLDQTEETVPVSRSLTAEIKELLSA